MKKSILMLMAGLLAFGTVVSAMASSRLDSMSSDPREIEDADLIWLYPNKVLEYKNTADFRLTSFDLIDGVNYGDGTNEWGGVIAEESSLGGVLGVYVNRPAVLLDSAANVVNDPSNFLGGVDPLRYYWSGVGGNLAGALVGLSNIVDLFWAQNLGGADLGVHFGYGNNGLQNPIDADQMSLGLGLGFANVGPFSQLNLHADYQMVHATANAPTPIHDNGIYTIKLGALGQADLSTDNFARVFADFSLNQDNISDITDPLDYNFNDFTGLVGLSCSHKVNGGKGLVSTGLVFDYVGSSMKLADPFPGVTNDVWNLVWTGSLETQVFDWLTLRAGIQKAIVSRDYNSLPFTPGPTYTDNSNDNVNFSTGFGINWQNWVLDANVDVTSLENSINGVTPGNGLLFTNGNPIVQVATADLKYKF